MSEYPLDELSLKLLQLVCSGTGVAINISELASTLERHRTTIKDRVDKLFEYEIISKPYYPLSLLFDEYPLFVMSKSEFLRDQKTNSFIETDAHIYTAFFFKEECYNTFLLEFHRDINTYQTWREQKVAEAKITVPDTRCPSKAFFYSTKRFLKYDPSVSIDVVKNNLDSKRHTEINNFPIDDLSFEIMDAVLKGKCIRTNENFLAKELDVNRKTIEKRIQSLLENHIVNNPVCRFPTLLVPPEYMLVITMIEIRRIKDRESVMQALKDDPHVVIMLKGSISHYNLTLMCTFYKIEDHLQWQEELTQRFPECIGAVNNTYLSPKMMFAVRHEAVAHELIKKKLKALNIKA